MRTTIFVLLLAAAAVRGPARAVPAAGLRFQRAIYVDSAGVALRNPEGVACDERGTVVVADTGNGRLLTYAWKDGALEGGTQVKIPQVTYPVRVQIDPEGFVLALDRRSRRIARMDARGEFAGWLDPRGASGPVTVASFKLDAAGNVYVLDVVAHKVLVVSPEGSVKRELPVPQASGITDVAADSAGRVYVVDAVAAVVFSAEPEASSFQPLSKSLKEMVGFPIYLSPDDRGKLYLVDQNGNGVVRIGIDGTFQGRELAMGRGEGGVYYPAQLCITQGGDVFIADRSNNRVQVFSTPR